MGRFIGFNKQIIEWAGRGRASPRDACVLGSFRRGGAKESPHTHAYLPQQHLVFTVAAAESCLQCFPTLIAASPYLPSHPLLVTSTCPQMPVPAAWPPLLRSLGLKPMWFHFQVQRHFIREQATYSKRSSFFLSHDVPLLRDWVSAMFFYISKVL